MRKALPLPDKLYWYPGHRTGWPVLRFVAHHRMRQHTTIPLYTVSVLHLAMVASGTLQLRMNGQAVAVPANRAAIYRPGVAITNGAAPNAASVYYVGLDLSARALALCPVAVRGDLAELGRRVRALRGNSVALNDRVIAAARECFEAVHAEASPMACYAAGAKLLETLTDVLGAAPVTAREGDAAAIGPALKLLERSDVQPCTIAELARACGMGRSGFIEAFKRAMGSPPHEWLNRERIKRAAERIARGEPSLTRLALELGFATPQHFSVTFKRLMGVSPGHFGKSPVTKSSGRRR